MTLDNTIQQARSETIQSHINQPFESSSTFFPVLWMAKAGLYISPWWSPRRDEELRKFWKRSDHLSGAIFTMLAKMTTIPFSVVARDQANKEHVKQANEITQSLIGGSQFGDGWGTFFSKFVEDLLCTDNGAFAEIIGPGRADGPLTGRPITVAHLDSKRCTRTGNAEYPVVYEDTDGKRYKLHYTRVIYMSQMTSPSADMNGVGFCLHRDATVVMADGSTKRIADIVKNRDPGPVLSIDQDGKVVSKKITNWYNNPRQQRRLINIRGKYSRLVQGRQERNSWVTEDHPILTPSGWKRAGELKNGDLIITHLPQPNDKQMRFLVGSLLGDGCLTKMHDRPRFTLGHCSKQKEWFDLKEKLLKQDFGFKTRSSVTTLEVTGNKYESINGQTHSHSGFIELYERFYQNGRKVAPINLIEKYFSPIMLATWYLDDGNIVDRNPNQRGRRPHARISTNDFTVSEVEKLVEILNNNGYKSSVISARGNKKQRNIRISVDGSEKLFKDIAPYVPNTMRYKIPDGYAEYDENLWNLGSADLLVDEVIVSDEWNHYDSRTGNLIAQPDRVYCIDVEDTHNFISAGIVVHNCAVSRCINVSQTLIDILTFKQEKLGSRPHRAIIITKGGLAPDDVKNAFQLAEQDMDSQSLQRFAKIVLAGDPSLPEAGLDLLELTKLPDGFDEETSTILGMATIALALGTDARELFPAMSSGATRADALLMHLKQRGKGPGQILQITEQHFNHKYLPPHLELIFDFQDDAQDRQIADIKLVRANKRKQDLDSGALSVRVIREQMLDTGDLTREQFERIELTEGRLENGLHVLTLFYSDDAKIKELLDLGVDDPLDLDAIDEDAMMVVVRERISEVNKIVINTRSDPARAKAFQALMALIYLEKYYLKPQSFSELILGEDTPPSKPDRNRSIESRVRTEDLTTPNPDEELAIEPDEQDQTMTGSSDDDQTV